jgi:hypothetical protein
MKSQPTSIRIDPSWCVQFIFCLTEIWIWDGVAGDISGARDRTLSVGFILEAAGTLISDKQ